APVHGAPWVVCALGIAAPDVNTGSDVTALGVTGMTIGSDPSWRSSASGVDADASSSIGLAAVVGAESSDHPADAVFAAGAATTPDAPASSSSSDASAASMPLRI